MNQPNTLMGRERDQIIADAVHEKARLVLTCRGTERWETHKSRLLDMAPARRALVLAFPIDVDVTDFDVSRGEQIGVSFRHHNRKCLFGSTVIGKRQPRRHSHRHTSSRALLVAWPEEIEQLQRRVYYRVPIPDDQPIEVMLWPGVEPDMIGNAACCLTGRLQDLSVGGMRVEIQRAADPKLDENQLVAVRFQPLADESPMTLEACYRHVEPMQGDKLSLGFQFIGLEIAPNSKSLLAGLASAVSQLQRFEKRSR